MRKTVMTNNEQVKLIGESLQSRDPLLRYPIPSYALAILWYDYFTQPKRLQWFNPHHGWKTDQNEYVLLLVNLNNLFPFFRQLKYDDDTNTGFIVFYFSPQVRKQLGDVDFTALKPFFRHIAVDVDQRGVQDIFDFVANNSSEDDVEGELPPVGQTYKCFFVNKRWTEEAGQIITQLLEAYSFKKKNEKNTYVMGIDPYNEGKDTVEQKIITSKSSD